MVLLQLDCRLLPLLVVSSFFFSSRRRHTRSLCDWSSDVCSSDLALRHRGIRYCPTAAALERKGGREMENAHSWRRYCYSHHLGRPYLYSNGGSGEEDCRLSNSRSEERRVGKEFKSRWWAEQ